MEMNLYCILTSNATCVVNTIATSNAVEISVSENVEAQLSIIADLTEICENEPVTFTAFPENGGDTPVYQWFINSFPIGGNLEAITFMNLQNGDLVSCQMLSVSPCVSNPNAFSNELTITVSDNVDALVSIDASSLNLCEGEEASFSAVPVHGGTTPSFKWFVNDILVQDGNVNFNSNNLNDGGYNYL